MKQKLKLDNFTRKGVVGKLGHYLGYYFSHILPDGKEVCLEACMSGYCVAIYDKESGNLIGKKTCTNLKGYELFFLGAFEMRNSEAIKKAIKIANQKIKKL